MLCSTLKCAISYAGGVVLAYIKLNCELRRLGAQLSGWLRETLKNKANDVLLTRTSLFSSKIFYLGPSNLGQFPELLNMFVIATF